VPDAGRDTHLRYGIYMNNKEFFVLLSTCPDAATAERLGRVLVEESRAACVNVLPGLRSIYRWNEAVHCDEEALMIIKTTAAQLAAARERLVALHPYEVPEVVALPVAEPELGLVGGGTHCGKKLLGQAVPRLEADVVQVAVLRQRMQIIVTGADLVHQVQLQRAGAVPVLAGRHALDVDLPGLDL